MTSKARPLTEKELTDWRDRVLPPYMGSENIISRLLATLDAARLSHGRGADTEWLRRFVPAAASALHGWNRHIDWEGNRPTSKPFDWTTNCQHDDCVNARQFALSVPAPTLPELVKAVETLLEEINVVIGQDEDPDWLKPYAAKVREALRDAV